MLFSSSPQTLSFYSRILKKPQISRGIQKLSKQGGGGESSIQCLCLKVKRPLSFFSFFLREKVGKLKKVLKSVDVIYECPLRLYFLRNFKESLKNLKPLIYTSNFRVFWWYSIKNLKFVLQSSAPKIHQIFEMSILNLKNLKPWG